MNDQNIGKKLLIVICCNKIRVIRWRLITKQRLMLQQKAEKGLKKAFYTEGGILRKNDFQNIN
jgi:hypothetical protein